MIRQIVQQKFRKTSYAQSGEDLIVDFIFRNLTKEYITSYMDIGSFHPFLLNNTAVFYNRGIRGINIDPNPAAITLFNKYRRSDINVQCGISTEEGVLNFYMFRDSTLNTFSYEEMKKRETDLINVTEVPVKRIGDVISDYARDVFPDFLSLDVEGLDLDILKSIDYQRSFPKVICVETVLEKEPGIWEKQVNILNYLRERDYVLHSDTGINSIFISRSCLKQDMIIV